MVANAGSTPASELPSSCKEREVLAENRFQDSDDRHHLLDHVSCDAFHDTTGTPIGGHGEGDDLLKSGDFKAKPHRFPGSLGRIAAPPILEERRQPTSTAGMNAASNPGSDSPLNPMKSPVRLSLTAQSPYPCSSKWASILSIIASV
jgi:hypothetical protein